MAKKRAVKKRSFTPLLFLLLGILLLILLFMRGGENPCAGMEGSVLDLCVIDHAVETGNGKECNALPEAKRIWCLNTVAEALESEEVCKMIDDDMAREFCLRDRYIAAGDATSCASLEQYQPRDDCYFHLANETLDWTLCSEMSRSEYRENCFYDVSVATPDAEGCFKMNPLNIERRETCIFIASIKSFDTETCQELADQDAVRYCLLNIAMNANDLAICDSIPDPVLQRFCTKTVLNETA